MRAGCLRAGWYSNDLLDNLAHPSATTVLPSLRHLEIGQPVPMAPTPSETSDFTVQGFDISTWVWKLTPTDDGGTRLLTRIHALRDRRHPIPALLGLILMEFGDFAMCRRMPRGIKPRAEAAAREVTASGPVRPSQSRARVLHDAARHARRVSGRRR